VQLLDQGNRGIEQTLKKAYEFGAVLDTDIVDAAAELHRKFGELATAVDMRLKGAIIGAMRRSATYQPLRRGWASNRTSMPPSGPTPDGTIKVTTLVAPGKPTKTSSGVSDAEKQKGGRCRPDQAA